MDPSALSNAAGFLDVPASGRKETHASPICFWGRRFGEPSRNSSRVAALADCWRLRSDSSVEVGAPRIWIHLNRIRKKQMEEKTETGHSLYDIVSLLRVIPSIRANLEPYSEKVNGKKIEGKRL